MILLPVEEAQLRLLASSDPLDPETVPLLSACGRYLSKPVTALRDQPWANLSAMDGYAIRHADMPGPWRLDGRSQAGGVPPAELLAPGAAWRIFTGAPLPPGADTVLIQEDAAVVGDSVILNRTGPEHAGKNVRPRATDFESGAVLLDSGVRLGPSHIALAAMAGHATLPVRRRPKVAILSTGDELIPVGAPPSPGKIPASNDIMLAAMLIAQGAEIIDIGIVPDRLEAVRASFLAAEGADIIVSTGGASVGDHDLVAPGLEAAGGKLDFWKLALRPGKPLMAGTLGQAAFLGLPGNPVSAFVTATLFLLPLVRHMAGAAASLPDATIAHTDIALSPGGSRAEYLRAIVANGRVKAVLDRDSAGLRALSQANALLVRPVNAPPVRVGETVEVILIETGCFA